MSTGINLLIGAVAILGIAAIPACGVYNAAKTGNKLENSITAQYEDNQNKLSQMSLSVTDSVQVTGLAAKQLTEVIKAAMEGRYGNDKNLLAKSVTEAYPGTLDTAMYAKLMNLIESGRRDFANEQTKMIDKTRVYKTALGEPIGGIFLSFAGYPKINFDDYKIVISDYTADAFTKKRDNGLKIGG